MLYWEKRDHEKDRHNWHAATFGHDLLGDSLTATAIATPLDVAAQPAEAF